MSIKQPQANCLEKNSLFGITQMAIGACLISFSSVFVKLSSTGPTADGVYRMLFGGIVLFLLAVLRKERLWSCNKVFAMQFLCSLCISLDIVMWHRSILLIGPGLATILGNFQVFFLILIGLVIFKEKIAWGFLLGVILAVAGMFLLVGINWNSLGNSYKLGVFYGLATALFYSIFTVFLRSTQLHERSLKPVANLGVISLLSAGIVSIVGIIDGDDLRIVTNADWFYLLAYGINSQVIGWIFISRGLPFVGVSLAGLLILLQPSLSFVWDIVFFQRPTTQIDIWGALLTLIGLYLGVSSSNRNKTKMSKDESGEGEKFVKEPVSTLQ